MIATLCTERNCGNNEHASQRSAIVWENLSKELRNYVRNGIV